MAQDRSADKLCSARWSALYLERFCCCTQKTLGLVMIVKDEVGTINITLGSIRDHVDDWTIVDTGSNDGTQVSPRPALSLKSLHTWY